MYSPSSSDAHDAAFMRKIEEEIDKFIAAVNGGPTDNEIKLREELEKQEEVRNQIKTKLEVQKVVYYAKKFMKRAEEKEEANKRQLRDLREQLQTAKEHAEGLTKKMAGMEGALDRRMTEVESLAGDVQSLLEQLKKDDVSRKSLILTKDRENDKLVSELKRKDKKIQKLSKEMEVLKKAHKQELAHEKLSAQRHLIELGQKLLNCRVQDLAEIATELAAQLVNVKEEEVTDPAGAPGNQDEGEVETSHSSPEPMVKTEDEVPFFTTDCWCMQRNCWCRQRKRRRKRSYTEMPDEWDMVQCKDADCSSSSYDESVEGDEGDGMDVDDEEEMEPDDLEGMPHLSPQI